MNKLLGSWFLLGLSATLSAQSPDPESRIQVYVYNYAAVAPAVLTQAESTAARIHARAGIQAKFIDCPISHDQAAQLPPCEIPDSPAALVMRVLSRPMSESFGLTPPTYGSALFPPNGGLGMVAQVCAHCAEETAKGYGKLYALILGHTMAHELGHLLLGTGSHGPTGIMHSPWREYELQKIAQCSLPFSPQEAERMRRQVAERLRGEASVLEARR